jgi:imidazolonepropionase-like amidohydrolase
MKDELEQLHAAGLTNYEVLQSATINAARFLGNMETAGTVVIGKMADLVLLNANPLDNIDNAFALEGVMLHGTWFPEDVLQQNLGAAFEQSKRSES